MFSLSDLRIHHLFDSYNWYAYQLYEALLLKVSEKYLILQDREYIYTYLEIPQKVDEIEVKMTQEECYYYFSESFSQTYICS